MWDKKHLNMDGEPPKIFPFTKFNIARIQGNYNRDKKGNPSLKKGRKKGEFFDTDGNRVNKKGYLVDGKGNVIDRRGDMVFKGAVLDKNGEIPMVFRNGLLR